MNIVTRPDFDGVVCAVFLQKAVKDVDDIVWIEPYEMQERSGEIGEGDIIANLPYHSKCSLWFDHHESNRLGKTVPGAFAIVDSAAGLIHDYYENVFSGTFADLRRAADRIDAARLETDEVLNPRKYPFLLVANTIRDRGGDPEYCSRLVKLLANRSIDKVLEDALVAEKAEAACRKDETYVAHLRQYTTVSGAASITDFRPLMPPPRGGRFLVYSLFPEAAVNARIRYDKDNPDKVILSLGSNIFSQGCNVHLGNLMERYGGGGHRGAASCSFERSREEAVLGEILPVLSENAAP